MKRRNFVKTTAIGSTIMMTNGFWDLLNKPKMNLNPLNKIDPIIPFEFFKDLEKEMLTYIKYLRESYGFRKFLVVGPSKEYRYTGFPEKQVFIDLGEQILSLNKQLNRYDIEIGWWCTTTIRIGKGKFQSIIKADGNFAIEACCPLDQGYRETFSNYVATVVQIAKPFMVNFEDDYHLNNGCYCPLHLTEFGKRQNKNYSREELLSIFQQGTPNSNRLSINWGELKRDSLALLARSVREEVDKIKPDTRLCLCESGASERDGNFAEAVTQALAGKTRPAIRVHGTSYFSDDPLNIPQSIFNPLFKKQHLPPSFEILHESDTFPHTRFFMSSSKMKSLLTAAFAYGLDNSLLYVNQYLENPLEEEGYCKMFKKELYRFEALKAAVTGCKVDGCEILRKPGTSYNWVQIMGRHGIPYTSIEGMVKLVSGNIIDQMDKEEITKLLHGNVFLDGYSARQISKIGLGKLLGAEIYPNEKTLLPPFYEGIRNPKSFENINNRLMYNYLWAFNSQNTEATYHIEPFDDAEVVTDFLNSKNQRMTPGLIQFENELGGRIATMAFNLNDNYVCTRSISLFNYSKKEIIRQVIEWVGKEPLPVFVKNTPNTFCIFNRSKTNDYAIIVVINLGSDTFNAISLDIAPEWINSKFELMNPNGEWRPVKMKVQNRTVKANVSLSLMDPVILRITK